MEWCSPRAIRKSTSVCRELPITTSSYPTGFRGRTAGGLCLQRIQRAGRRLALTSVKQEQFLPSPPTKPSREAVKTAKRSRIFSTGSTHVLQALDEGSDVDEQQAAGTLYDDSCRNVDTSVQQLQKFVLICVRRVHLIPKPTRKRKHQRFQGNNGVERKTTDSPNGIVCRQVKKKQWFRVLGPFPFSRVRCRIQPVCLPTHR